MSCNHCSTVSAELAAQAGARDIEANWSAHRDHPQTCPQCGRFVSPKGGHFCPASPLPLTKAGQQALGKLARMKSPSVSSILQRRGYSHEAGVIGQVVTGYELGADGRTMTVEALEKLARMKSPSVPEILKRKGFGYEAGVVKEVTDAVMDYQDYQAAVSNLAALDGNIADGEWEPGSGEEWADAAREEAVRGGKELVHDISAEDWDAVTGEPLPPRRKKMWHDQKDGKFKVADVSFRLWKGTEWEEAGNETVRSYADYASAAGDLHLAKSPAYVPDDRPLPVRTTKSRARAMFKKEFPTAEEAERFLHYHWLITLPEPENLTQAGKTALDAELAQFSPAEKARNDRLIAEFSRQEFTLTEALKRDKGVPAPARPKISEETALFDVPAISPSGTGTGTISEETTLMGYLCKNSRDARFLERLYAK